MPNQVLSGNKSFSEVILEGEQTLQNTVKMIQDSLPLNHAQAISGQPIKILMNMSGVTKFEPGAIRSAIGANQSVAFDKIAIYGTSSESEETVKHIISESGSAEKIRLFSTREEAIAWLEA